MNSSPQTPRTTLHYGWIVLVLTFVTISIAAGARSAPSVFILPLEGEFGWSRTAISSAIGLNLLMFGVAAPVAGWFIDRRGPKQVMLVSLLLLALGVAGTLMMSQLWQLTLFMGIVVGLGSGGGATVLGATVSNRWFVKHRGLTLGILNSGVSTGQLIFLPLLMAAVVQAGWRAGSLVLLAVSLGMLVVVALWMRNDPEEIGLQPYGANEVAGLQPTGSNPAAGGFLVPIPTLLRHPVFWLLAAAFFACGVTSVGLVLTHLIPYSSDLGISPVMAASAAGIMGGTNFLGVIVAGWLTDRYDTRRILALTFALRAISLFMLPFIQSPAGLLFVAVVFGLNWFATVPPIVAIIGDTFGKRSVGTVYGGIFLIHQIGASLAATGGGMVRQELGSYELAFWAGGVLALMGIVFALTIPRHRQLMEARAA